MNDIQTKVALWRQACVDGTWTLDQAIEAMAYLRGTRKSALQSKRATTSTKPVVNADDLLGELMG